MALRRISPQAYRRWTLAAVVSLVIIIVTGAAVRLTGSGLGCSRWPECEKGQFIGASNAHQTIEQVNRFFTGVMIIVIIGAVAGSLLRMPRRRDLTRLSLALVVGILLQAVVGGIVVKTRLHPLAVIWHFLISAVMLAGGLVLHQRAQDENTSHRLTVPATVRRIVLACGALGAIVVISGTVVTGTGPHSGAYKNDPVRRFGFHLDTVAKVHSILVMALLATLLFLFLKIRRTDAWLVLEDRLTAVLFAVFVQGAIGYVQYFTKLPVGVVAAHIAGSTAVMITLTRLVLRTRESMVSEAVSLAGVVPTLR